MTVRRILSVGHPTLRVRAAEVANEDIPTPAIQELIDDVSVAMRHGDGSGVAPNQIRATVGIMVVEVHENPRDPYKPPIPLAMAINPRFEPLDDETVVINEGCLSVPLRGELERSVNLRVRYADRDGLHHRQVLRGLTAGTWQHECDHLDGVLVVDRIDPKTLSTWEEFDRHHRDAFVERINRFVAEVGS